MPIEIQDKIIEFIDRNKSHIDNLSITWYGGEPLLAIDIIENLSNKIIEICKDNRINYYAGIITNGYKLNKQIAIKLNKLNISDIQITLDGPPEIHNKRRPLIDGKDTFYTILDNLKACVDILNNISIRINVDKKNIDYSKMIINIFNEYDLTKKVFLYLGYVETTNECYSRQECLEYEEYAKIYMEFNRYFIKNNHNVSLKSYYPSARGNVCCADSNNSFVISPDGEMYKCWNDIGIKKYSIGNICNIQDKVNISGMNRLQDFIMYDVSEDKECKNCSYLPICLGGCPRRRLDKEKSRCIDLKYTINSYINELAESLYKDKYIIKD